MKATKLNIIHNETRRYITIRGNGDISAEDAIKFAEKAIKDFGTDDTWAYIEFQRIEYNRVVVMFERRI